MKNKKRCVRLFSALVICMILVSATCPSAFAAEFEYIDTGFIVDPVNFDPSSFVRYEGSSSVFWYLFLDLSGSIFEDDNTISVMVWLDDQSYNCRSMSVHLSESDTTRYFIGNYSLFSSSGANTGEPFCLIINPGDYSKCEFVLSDQFYSGLVSDDMGDCTFAIQPIYQPGFTGSVSAGLFNTTHWVGQVIFSLISPDGALAGLLPMLAIIVAVPALILGIKVIRSIIWGS